MLDHDVFFLADVPIPPFDGQPDSPNIDPARSRLRILVVDDERLIADTVADILKQHGFDAHQTYSGHEAVEACRRVRPDIVLSDVLMPKMSGIELGIKIRQEMPSVRIFLFSGQAAAADLMHKANTQGHEFELLPKPIHPEELVARLRAQ